MLRTRKNKNHTVSEKVAELLVHPNGSETEESADEATAPRIVDFEEDEYEQPEARSTDIRKRNVKLLSDQSTRYKGQIVSRKDIEIDEQETSGDDAETDDSDLELKYEQSDDTDEAEGDAALAAFNNKLKVANGNKRNAEESESEDNQAYMDQDTVKNDTDHDKIMAEFYQKAQQINGTTQVDYNGDYDEDSENDPSESDEQNTDNDDGASVSDEQDSDEADDNETTDATAGVISSQNQQAELQKGVCVQNQLSIWERLLELRINTQKIITKSNQLPTPDTLNTQDEALQAALSSTQQSTGKLLKQLLELQGTLSHQFSELRTALKTTQKRPSPFNGDAPEPKRLADHLKARFQEIRPYRNSVLLRWDDRTKLLTPGAGAKKKSIQEDYDILKKINNTLANRNTLIAKSQLLKNTPNAPRNAAVNEDINGDIADIDAQTPRNVNIYDDSDFYHQQLRELIEYKANTSTNMSEITKQFVELQKLRQKMKKKVDTRASKGRKLRYVVHNKLINFMAPDETSNWTEESTNELCKSLFV